MSLQITLDGQSEAIVRSQLAQGHARSPEELISVHSLPTPARESRGTLWEYRGRHLPRRSRTFANYEPELLWVALRLKN